MYSPAGTGKLIIDRDFFTKLFQGGGARSKGEGWGGEELNTTIGLEEGKLNTLCLLGYRGKSWIGFRLSICSCVLVF